METTEMNPMSRQRLSTSNPSGSGFNEAKSRYIEKMTGLTKTPRE